MKDITISFELANAILGYLAGRPYGEVFQMIQGIQQAAQPEKGVDK